VKHLSVTMDSLDNNIIVEVICGKDCGLMNLYALTHLDTVP